MSAPRRRPVLLALFLALVTTAVELPTVHDHAAATPGLYDEECPPSRLATGCAGVTFAAFEAPHPLPAADAPRGADRVAAPIPPLSPFDARAPPTAS